MLISRLAKPGGVLTSAVCGRISLPQTALEEFPEQSPQPEASVPGPAAPLLVFAAGAFTRTARDSARATATCHAEQRGSRYGAETKLKEAPAAHDHAPPCVRRIRRKFVES